MRRAVLVGLILLLSPAMHRSRSWPVMLLTATLIVICG